jgi:Na+/H+ antiporter NhaC
VNSKVEFYGGNLGAATPFVLFLSGVAWLGLSGAPDERGFWPVLLAGLAAGVALARDRTAYSEAVLHSMGKPLVMVMVMAWLLAGVLGTLVSQSGFVPALVGVVQAAGVSGGGYVGFSFLIAALVSTATGTSLGTILVCAPLLYPAGGPLAADPVLLIAAIMGGATFGDNVSPVSDTTIASATTQGADIGGVVRSRLKYAVPAGAVALILFTLLGRRSGAEVEGIASVTANPSALFIIIGPVVTLFLMFARRHLLEGLMAGILVTIGVGIAVGSFGPGDLLFLDRENFIARGLILEGMQGGVGVSIFTMLLMGLVGGLQASGLVDRVLAALMKGASTARGAETRVFTAVSAGVFLTTHPVVAIIAVGEMAVKARDQLSLSRYRMANLLDATVCTYPFLLPFFIPTILASSATASGADFGMPRVSPLEAGLYNFHSWALLLIMIGAIATGFGRRDGESH